MATRLLVGLASGLLGTAIGYNFGYNDGKRNARIRLRDLDARECPPYLTWSDKYSDRACLQASERSYNWRDRLICLMPEEAGVGIDRMSIDVVGIDRMSIDVVGRPDFVKEYATKIVDDDLSNARYRRGNRSFDIAKDETDVKRHLLEKSDSLAIYWPAKKLASIENYLAKDGIFLGETKIIVSYRD